MKRKILVVDDSRTIRMQLKAALEADEFEVEEAQDGLQGLEVLDKVKGIALLIIDINMPVMDGLTMMEKIKENGTHAKIPMVVLTTEGSQEAIARAKAAGAKGWLVKPYKPEQILQTAKKLLDESPAE